MADIDEQQSVAYYNSRPAKRTGAGVLIFNQQGELLIVKPTYRNTWQWPGGGIDENESPLHAALRECEEEIGVHPGHLQPAFVNYIPSRDDGTKDSIHFVFIGKPVSDTFLQDIKLQTEELEDARFVAIKDIHTFIKEYRVRALKAYLNRPADGQVVYLEDGFVI